MGARSESWNTLALEGFLAEAQTLRSLVGVSIEDWVVLQKSTFDIRDNNEPHIAQTLYMEKATGRYLHKIFGRTIQDGRLDAPSGLKDLAQDIFEHSRVCQGFRADIKVEPGITLTPGLHPYPRQIDPKCQLVFKDPNGQAIVCPNCTRALNPDLADPLSQGQISGLLENPRPVDVKNENDLALDDVHDFAMYEPETALWVDHSPSKVIKYAESDCNGEDEIDKKDEEEIVSPKRRKTRTLANVSSRSERSGTSEVNQKSLINVKGEDPSPGLHCSHCNKLFTPDKYRRHRAFLSFHRYKIPCKVCGKSCPSFDSLAKHMSTKHSGCQPIALRDYLQTPEQIETMKRAQKCSTCDLYFNGLLLVNRHRALYHEMGDFKCEDCNQPHLTYYHLVLHNYNTHSRLTPYLEPTTKDLDVVNHKDGAIEQLRRRYVCPKCDKSYKYDGEWGLHMKIHHSWSVFTCEECRGICHYASDFVAHVKNFHAAKPEIKCPICSDVFCLKEDPECFDTHFKDCPKTLLNRYKPKTRQCEKCGKNFATNYHLQCHLKSHDGEEKFVCDKCDYGTNLKAVMRDHQKSHLRAEGKTHDAEGNSLFLFCDQCPKKLTSRNALKLHIRLIHEGVKRELKCSDCDLTFDTCTKLYTHKRKVHGFVTTKSRRGRQLQ